MHATTNLFLWWTMYISWWTIFVFSFSQSHVPLLVQQKYLYVSVTAVVKGSDIRLSHHFILLYLLFSLLHSRTNFQHRNYWKLNWQKVCCDLWWLLWFGLVFSKKANDMKQLTEIQKVVKCLHVAQTKMSIAK